MTAKVPFDAGEATFAQIAAAAGVSDKTARKFYARGARTTAQARAMARESKARQWWGARKGARVAAHVSLLPGEFRK